MTPRNPGQVAKDTTVSNTEALSNTELAKQYGFKFVTEDKVPPPSRGREVDTDRWNAVKTFLTTDERAHGQWAMIKEFDKAGSAQAKASAINNDNNKSFPKTEGWEARAEVTEKKTDEKPGKSRLYVRYTPVKQTAESK
jgi:hypothetical protein